MNKKILIVDGQVFQTPAWHRGMGKYSLELLSALQGYLDSELEEIILILSNNFDQDRQVMDEINRRLPELTIVSLDLQPNIARNSSVSDENRKKIDAYITDEINEKSTSVSFLILSLMQGEIQPTFPSIAGIHKLALFYDLIPLMYHGVYLGYIPTEVEYLSKIPELLKADTYIAISETVANDLAIYLGINPERIININGGPIEHSGDVKEFNIPKPFILMPTGNDLRKNNRRGIIAFNTFNERHKNKYSLVITSFFKEEEIIELSKLSDNVIFTGNISGEELNYLYKHSDSLFFPSEYEGLGLPILEALENDKPVSCSDISVFREMSKTAFKYFNPYSVESMIQSLESSNNAFSIDKESYSNVLKKYTWDNSASALMSTLNVPTSALRLKKKPRVAIFIGSPTCGSYSSRMNILGHAELSRVFVTDYYYPLPKINKELRSNFLPYVSESMVRKQSSITSYTSIYHLSNCSESAETILFALANPGLLVLHDINLEKPWVSALNKGLISQSRYNLEEVINSKLNTANSSFLASLLSRQRAVIVFSDYAKDNIVDLLKTLNADTKVYKGNIPTFGLPYTSTLPQKIDAIGIYDKESRLNKQPELEFIKGDEDDMTSVNHLSGLKEIIFTDELAPASLPGKLLCSVPFGVVPVVPDKGCFNEIPPKAKITYESGSYDDILADPSGLLNGTGDRGTLVQAHFLKNNTFQQYAELLHRVITECDQYGEDNA